MKKTPRKKTSKQTTVRPVATKSTIKSVKKSAAKPCLSTWSLSIYVYWFIILFFIAATFYILGRSHNDTMTSNNIQITEEVLMQANDYYESGKTKLLAGNVDDAIADLTTSIDGGAASVDAYILRGEAYLQTGDYRNAMDDFNAALAKDPANAVAYYDRSLLNTRLEDYAAAMNDINNALAANVTHPSQFLQMRDLYAKRGQLNLWMKNWEGAIADYTNSLARPEGSVNPTVYADRAEAYTAIGDYAAAMNDYGSAVRVISEQIQGLPSMEEREALSSNAMAYFEKSAALNLKLNDIEMARVDLESAYTIAVALNDTETMERLRGLIDSLQESDTQPQESEIVTETTSVTE